ncbi:hypothetical protein GMRT_16104 [Giardia muris]|uniref:EF-hand domain-containing protein n=1 Tax=Giardia muris TaxID=5742 RepID=A0A4Z1T8F5_GIAMU|nr:hypothetical protein GMRT_16104 [Giardia muris]|eukprot:TNJ30403.1 hypothetical protein GMRT_16104 [Giardia muris]
MSLLVSEDAIAHFAAQNPSGITPTQLLDFLTLHKVRPDALNENLVESVMLMCSSRYSGTITGHSAIKRAVYVFSNYTKDQYYALYLYFDQKFRGVLNSEELIAAIEKIQIGLSERACASMLSDHTAEITEHGGITYRVFMQVLVKCIIFRRQFLDALSADGSIGSIKLKR